MKKFLLILLFCFILSCEETKYNRGDTETEKEKPKSVYYVFEVYQNGVKIDEICDSRVSWSYFQGEGRIYFRYTGVVCK